MLKLVEGADPKPKSNMELLYLNAFRNKLVQPVTPDTAKQVSLLGVKYINAAVTAKNKMTADTEFAIIECVQMFMAQLTPREFMQLFPIEKTYDGDKLGCKDYFYVMKYINTLDLDKPIGGERKLFDFLWEYQNWEINEFLVETFSTMDDLMHQQGKDGPLDKMIDELGITPYYIEKDSVTGQQFILNGSTGKSKPVMTAVPRYLKLVKQ